MWIFQDPSERIWDFRLKCIQYLNCRVSKSVDPLDNYLFFPKISYYLNMFNNNNNIKGFTGLSGCDWDKHQISLPLFSSFGDKIIVPELINQVILALWTHTCCPPLPPQSYWWEYLHCSPDWMCLLSLTHWGSARDQYI